MNDLLEELVGDLGDEGEEIRTIEKKSPGLWHIHGGANLSEVTKATGLIFDTTAKNYDTFGGFVFDILGRLPDDGEQCKIIHPVKDGELLINVMEVKDRRLVSALVRYSKR
jgi:putative hemolysin